MIYLIVQSGRISDQIFLKPYATIFKTERMDTLENKILDKQGKWKGHN